MIDQNKVHKYAKIRLCDGAIVIGQLYSRYGNNEESAQVSDEVNGPCHSYIGTFIDYADRETRKVLETREHKGFTIEKRELYNGNIVYKSDLIGGLVSDGWIGEIAKIDNVVAHAEVERTDARVISRGLALYFYECIGRMLPSRDRKENYFIRVEGTLYRVNTTPENRNDFKQYDDDEQWYGIEINDEIIKSKATANN